MSELIYRNINIRKEDIDQDNRTISLSYSSEYAYKRDFGMEVLSHANGDCDMSFISSGNAPLLLDHDQSKQIGVIEVAEIIDSVGRAKVRFGQSELANEIYQDVIDGIRKNISVGYAITERQIITDNIGQKIVKCKWFPQEISICAIPVDKSVGVNRAEDFSGESTEINIELSAGIAEIQTTKRNFKMDNEKIENTSVDLDAVRTEAVKNDRARIADITAIATRHNVQDVAHEFINSGKSVDEFRAVVLDQLAKRPAVSTVAALGMSEKEVKNYSLGRAVKAMLSGDWNDAGLELEASRAAAKLSGRMQTQSNIFVPSDYLTRAAGANAVKTTGGHFVPTDHMSGNFIDTLFAKSIAAKLGVQYHSGLNGNVKLPKITSAATASWITEGADGTVSAVGQGSINLAPKTLAGFVEWTRDMSLQSDPFVETYLRTHIAQSIGQAVDAAIFAVGGSGAPVGILGDTSVTAWEAVPDNLAYTYASIYELVKNVDIANALTDNSKFAMSPTVKAILSVLVKDSNTAAINLLQDNKLAGYDVVTSTNVGNNIIFGDFSNVMVGAWSQLEIAVDTSTKFMSGGYLLRAMTDMDVAVTRGEAFSGYKNASTDPTP